MGVILNHRLGPKSLRPREYIVSFGDVTSRNEAAQLIGRKVVWFTEKGLPFVGKIVGTHGRKGKIRVRFRKGLPGVALGTRVELR